MIKQSRFNRLQTRKARGVPFFLVVALFSLSSFFYLPTQVEAEPSEKEAFGVLQELLQIPLEVWIELVGTVEAIQSLGAVRRFEEVHFHEFSSYASDGLRRWGAPFTELMVNPNASEKRKWDYRVQARKDGFTATARRRDGKYKGREIRFNHESEWSGNYPFWPFKNFPSLQKKASVSRKSSLDSDEPDSIIKMYHESGAIKTLLHYKDGELVKEEEYDEAGNLTPKK